MANIIGTHMAEGQSINRPPLFSGSNYNYWKARMKIYIQANDYACWNIIENGPIIPTKITENGEVTKPQKEWTIVDTKDVQNNAKAIHTLYCALDVNEFNRISGCETAKEIWDKLEVTHEGTSQVKESKISMLVHKYELFKMESSETISEMFTRFTDIINGLKSLGKVYTNVEMVRKILRCLPRSWGPKVTAIEEAKDLTKMGLDELLGSLMTHEITLKSNEENDEGKKKREIAFKTSSSQNNDELKHDEESDEDMALFTRRFNKMFKRGQFPRRQGRRNFDKNEEQKKDPIICFECKKPGHMKVDCPNLKKESRRDKRNIKFEKFKKAFAAWGESDVDTSDDESSDQEVANLCLVAQEDNKNEVHLESNSLNDLQDDYDDLYEESLKLINKNCMLRKQIASLSIEIETLKKHANELTSKNIELNDTILDLTKCLEKFTKGQKNLDLLLGSQRCVYDRAGIGHNTSTKQKLYKNIFVESTSFSTQKISCTYCNTEGHTKNTCYVKKCVRKGLKTIWVPKKKNATNIQGPNKIWVPKTNG